MNIATDLEFYCPSRRRAKPTGNCRCPRRLTNSSAVIKPHVNCLALHFARRCTQAPYGQESPFVQRLFMNDVNEFWWFYDRIAEYLETHDDVPQFIAEHITHLITRRGTRRISICAMCFSEDGDDASQWDRYALNGNGVAVGFDTERLKSIDRTEFQRVCYDPDKQVDFINKVVSELSRKYPNGTDSIGNVCDPLSRIAAGCKNPRFGAEKGMASDWVWLCIHGVRVSGAKRHYRAVCPLSSPARRNHRNPTRAKKPLRICTRVELGRIATE